ncbi:MAG: hypothetical protein M4579_005877 [Chaenotheca gracillima]|nr:MAG: hypothetical protein M4579_005877 [Chaenotheca gracillima]
MSPVESWLDQRNRLTTELYAHPYDLVLYIERAEAYSQLRYHDLAAGDAHRALLLTDEAQDDAEEYHEQAQAALAARLNNPNLRTKSVNAALVRVSSEQERDPSDDPEDDDDDDLEDEEARFVSKVALQMALQCYSLLSHSLLRCGCLKSALDFANRGLAAFPDELSLLRVMGLVMADVRTFYSKDDLQLGDFDKDELPDQGRARREVYPWNDYEPERFSDESLAFLNSEMAKVAPKCEVRATELPVLTESGPASASVKQRTMKQLGIFAKEDIRPGEVVLHEHSALIANNRLHESLCDACSSVLPDITSTRNPVDTDAVSQVVSCPDCVDIFFCNEACLQLALETYHPAVCGKEVETIAKNVPMKETSEALYLLLLLRAMATAESTDTHPLDLKEVKHIWGEFEAPAPASAAHHDPSNPSDSKAGNELLPFSFTYNIATPLHVLEKMDLDIYALLPRYDLWILNTLYAKFRGTASARVSLRDGRPEVCAVHPMWCLANHSCDPNVAWEWGAEMQFWARERRLSGPAGGKKSGGIAKGEEVLNHYCDIELPVRERREWAAGSLGGWCMCERCVREEGEEKEKERVTAVKLKEEGGGIG